MISDQGVSAGRRLNRRSSHDHDRDLRLVRAADAAHRIWVADMRQRAGSASVIKLSDDQWRNLTPEQVATLTPDSECKRLKALARLRQRDRRSRMLRIDYYPDAKTAKIIRAEIERDTRINSYTAVLDRIVSQWAAARDQNKNNDARPASGKTVSSFDQARRPVGY